MVKRQRLRWTAAATCGHFAECHNGIAQLLAAAGEDVDDVPTTLAARARLLDTGGSRKTDAADAASVAHAAIQHKRLRHVVAENDHTRLRLLSERRDDLARERVRLLNRLHVLLRDLIPGGAALDLTAMIQVER
ncbi:IS110 family transposase [Micromonospora sp. NBC_00389]|uniref:IS110 family transposase n=1 Tax=Micromonospora sp. NBC_00389 TaxID=2903586 RepID=UPI002E1CCB39